MHKTLFPVNVSVQTILFFFFFSSSFIAPLYHKYVALTLVYPLMDVSSRLPVEPVSCFQFVTIKNNNSVSVPGHKSLNMSLGNFFTGKGC